jgi:ATP-dependent Clp protease ATP-binding subunit ClpB
MNRVKLDPLLKCNSAALFHAKLQAKIVGQDEALDKLSEIVQTYKAGFHQKGKPLANVIFLGPSGSGKTHCVETLSHILFGKKKAFFKMDMGEFQNGSTVATLVGSPPGYLGFKESSPYISQEKLDKFQTSEYPVNIMLLDEIEKACDPIFQLLLGILDKATLTTSTGEIIDFSNTIIFMTSNLGSESIVNADKQGIGFTHNVAKKLDSQIKKTALKALEKKFSPEFVNRLDHSVVFNVLSEDSIRQILDLELLEVKQRIFTSKPHTKFTFTCTDKAKDFLLAEGYSPRYGARELKRVINKHITNPLASLMMSGQLSFGDLVLISVKAGQICYDSLSGEELNEYSQLEWEELKQELKLIDEVTQHEDMLVAATSESV